MLTLDQLISEATALPDATKAILIDKILESMTRQIDRDISIEGVKKAQERMPKLKVAQSKPFREILTPSTIPPKPKSSKIFAKLGTKPLLNRVSPSLNCGKS